jgi:spermidine/putrescine-binding protein
MTTPAVRLLTWADYVAPAVLAAFTTETGIGVEEVTFANEDEAGVRVAAGEPCDVVVATDYCAERHRLAGLLQPLDMERLPGFRGVTDARLRRPPYDPETDGHKYTSVLYFGTEGIAVRIDSAPQVRSSWEALFDPRFAGRIVMLDGAREVLATALYLLGESPNATDPGVVARATDMLLEQRHLVVAYDADTAWRHIVDGVAIVHCFDGEAARAINAGATQVCFLHPQEGFTLWEDGLCIPVAAPDPGAAHRFIDFLLRPEIAAANADFSGYHPAVTAAEPLMKSLVQRSLRPTPAQIETGTFLADLGAANAAYEAAYAKVRGLAA